MDNHLQYLNERITSVKQSHADFKERERASTSEREALAHNSAAAGVWDTYSELLNTKEHYLRTRPACAANPDGDDNHTVPEHLAL